MREELQLNEFLTDDEIRQVVKIMRLMTKTCFCDIVQDYGIIVKKLLATIRERNKPEGEPKIPIIHYYTFAYLSLRHGKKKQSSNITLTLDELYMLDENLSDFTTCRTKYKRYKECQIIRIKILNEILSRVKRTHHKNFN